MDIAQPPLQQPEVSKSDPPQTPQQSQSPPSKTTISFKNPYFLPIIVCSIGGVIYTMLLGNSMYELYKAIRFLDEPLGVVLSLPLAILTAIAFLFVVFANFGFVYFLFSKKEKSEVVQGIILNSFIIAAPPLLVYFVFPFLFFRIYLLLLK